MATQTTEHETGTETGLLTAPTYPLFAPYTRHGDASDTATLTGKPPRLMSIITTTLILTGSTCWNAEERTLTFGHDWQRLAGRLKLINGGATRDVLNNLLAAYCTEPFPTEDGDILIAEDAALDPDITTSRRWIRFTPEYLNLVTGHEAKEIPLDAIPGPQGTRHARLLTGKKKPPRDAQETSRGGSVFRGVQYTSLRKPEASIRGHTAARRFES